jgi:hypothetical protein
MGKAKRADKKERRQNREIEAEIRAAEQVRDRRRRLIVWSIPAVTVLVAVGFWFGLESPSLAGAAILGGAMIWLLVGLGFIGGAVRPRDRNRAGSIDFGNRR